MCGYDEGGAGLGRVITADAGAVEIAGAGGLVVADDITGNGDLTLSTGNVSIGGAMTVGGVLSVSGNETVTGLLDVTGTITGGGDIQSGNLIIAGNGLTLNAGSINHAGPSPVIDMRPLMPWAMRSKPARSA